jgi:4-amino-4-deoxy-L-arabinose transferase-like glycosyltransferase
MTMLRKHIVLALILGLIFCVSVAYSFAYRISPAVDAVAYDTIARNILAGCGFKEMCSQSYGMDTAITRAGPGYEFFLAGVYAVFGYHYEAVWILQALLHTATAFLLYCLAQRIFREEEKKYVGYGAVIIFGFWPDLIEISAMLLTETLYLFMTVLVTWFFVRLIKTQQTFFTGVLLGVLTGLAILVRPPIVLFIAIFAGYLLYFKKYPTVIGFVLGVISSLFPWVYRNYLVYHQFILTTMIGQFNIWVGNTLSSNGGQITSENNPVAQYIAAYGVMKFPQAASEAFRDFLGNHFVVFVELCARRFIRYFSLIRPMGFWFYQQGIKQLIFVTASGIWIATVFTSGIAGLGVLVGRRRDFWCVLLLVTIASPLLLLLTVVQSRYRFQIYPFLSVGAAYAFYLIRSKRYEITRPLLLSIVALGFISIVDAVIFFGTVIERLKTFI